MDTYDIMEKIWGWDDYTHFLHIIARQQKLIGTVNKLIAKWIQLHKLVALSNKFCLVPSLMYSNA